MGYKIDKQHKELQVHHSLVHYVAISFRAACYGTFYGSILYLILLLSGSQATDRNDAMTKATGTLIAIVQIHILLTKDARYRYQTQIST